MSQEQSVNILLVDDHAENLLALEATLSGLGQNLVRARSGKEALKCLLQQDFAVILLDVQMPGMDGFETAALIRGRERSQHTPIIFLTAFNTDANHVFQGYSLGGVDYLFKPILPEVLRSKVAVFVELWKKTKQIQQLAEQRQATIKELEHQIAERKRAEASLRRAHDKLEQRVAERTAGLAAAAVDNARLYREAQNAVRARDTFLSIAAHELKTPLTSLLGYADLLRRRAERDNAMQPRDQRAIQVICEQAKRLNRMIAALLDLSRIQTGQLSIERGTVDLGALVRRLAEEIRPTLQQHTLDLRIPDEPVIIEGDELRLEQVLQNLIQNAIKYSPAGGPVIVRVEREGDRATVAVSDQGMGIPSEALPKLFSRFYRADNVSDQHISGMGLGLFVVKEIITLHDGMVDVASQEGAGSTFTVRLPLAVPAEAV